MLHAREYVARGLAVRNLMQGSGPHSVVFARALPATAEIRQSRGSQQGASRDRDILLILYHETEGPSWHNNAGWSSDRPLGEWYGVTANSAGRVTALALRYNNLQGVLPPQLGGLSALEHLHITNNELFGGIPQELGQLQALQELRLYCNRLSGSIPPQLGRLHALKKLVLYSNKLAGAIPPELAELRSLEELLLSDNPQLEGNVPPELERTIARNRRRWATLPTRSTGTLSGLFSPIAGSPMANTQQPSRNTPRREQERPVAAGVDVADVGVVAGGVVADVGDVAGGVVADVGDVASGGVTAGGGGGGGGGGGSGDGGGGANGDGGGTGGVARGRRVPGRDKTSEPWVARILDYITDVWHVVLPIADDITSAWLLASTASAAASGAARPVWWACLLALSAAGLERAWLLVTLAATAFVIPLLFCARAALNLVSWCGRLCCTFPAGTVCCLLLMCCCQPCIRFAEEHPRGWRVTAARLFRRLNCTSTTMVARSSGGGGNVAAPPKRGGPSHATMFLDALLWAVVGSRARCSRFWEGLGWSLNVSGARQADGGAGGGNWVALTFGDVIDTWVGYHPFSWIGKAVFGRVRCRRRSGCWPSCKEGCTSKRGSSSFSTKNDNGDSSSSSSSSSSRNSHEKRGQKKHTASTSRRRRGQVLVRAVGETLVVDGLSLALSAVSRGGWNGSLTGIAGVSALFSALQLLTELRFYVKEASEALEPCVGPDDDGDDDVEGGHSSADSSDGYSSSVSSGSSISSSSEEENDGSEEKDGGTEGVPAFSRNNNISNV